MHSSEAGWYSTVEAAEMLGVSYATLYDISGLLISKAAGDGDEPRGAGKLWLIDDLIKTRKVMKEARLTISGAARVVKAIREGRV